MIHSTMISTTSLLPFRYIIFMMVYSFLCNRNNIAQGRSSGSQYPISSSESKSHADAKTSFERLVTGGRAWREKIKRIRRNVMNVPHRLRTSFISTPSLSERSTVGLSATASTEKIILATPALSIIFFPLPSHPQPPQPPFRPQTLSPVLPPPLLTTSTATISPPPPPPPPTHPATTPLPAPSYPTCYSDYSCKGRCFKKVLPQDDYVCHCDHQCEFFYDCCADFDRYCNSTSDHSTLPKHSRGLWNCQEQTSPNSWMIDRCPPSWPNFDDVINCTNNRNALITYENYAEVIPVFDSKNSITYTNRHCAKCNGAESKNLNPMA